MSLNEAATGGELKLPGAHFKQLKCFKKSRPASDAVDGGAGVLVARGRAASSPSKCRVLGEDGLELGGGSKLSVVGFSGI